jgi:hypothetical protein|tara:strand:- start:452 stop:586 length:135 start_codon:yes stop_codon:yes gene_type:complete
VKLIGIKTDVLWTRIFQIKVILNQWAIEPPSRRFYGQPFKASER